ncbi:hypothetical protein DOTSEDRAFT_75288 [Dothistroma septosporum NZE10]|uniref:Uncharacterized protein n=1 Tax=Dothistroma septosporum (strain NZE10 / CBS 128990) TaxID=675120 RepID=M2WKS1_DOTSN|nr:hypothetical protein DOTSEDRAFT_75288 [Dothistroma septosporum NZE10]
MVPREQTSATLPTLTLTYSRSSTLGRSCLMAPKQSSHVYQKVMTASASKYSFAMHAALRFNNMHDRLLFDPLGTKPSRAEAFHKYHAAALFGKQLATPLDKEVRDAMWATFAILGASAFAGIEATKAEEAWPLHPRLL